MIDTANGTINFPHVEKTLAMTDYCNPKPLQILAEENEILPPQQTTTNTAIVVTANINDVPAAVQPLPQFDDSASIIVAPALTTAQNKTDEHQNGQHDRIPIQLQKPHQTVSKFSNQKTRNWCGLSMVPPISYCKNIMTHTCTSRNSWNQWKRANGRICLFSFTRKSKHWGGTTPIQRRIIKEIRERIEKKNSDPTKDAESRKKNWRRRQKTTITDCNRIKWHVCTPQSRYGNQQQLQCKIGSDKRKSSLLPKPKIKLKEDLTVELALMHRYGIITTLPFSNYARSIFA